MKRLYKGALLIAALSFANGSFAKDEVINVVGDRAIKVAQYSDIEHVYEKFNQFPLKDRVGFSLRFIGDLLPNHDIPSLADLVIHSRHGDIPLFLGKDRDLHFPRSAELKQENPPILQKKYIHNRVRMELSMVIKKADIKEFSGAEARRWLGQVDNCIEDVTGVVFSWFMPDAHYFKIDLAPNSQLIAQTQGKTQTLDENRSLEPITVSLRPQSYPKETIFYSNKPFRRIRVKIPGDAYVTFIPQE
ncbi:DUF2987 domain-containing protein [Swingsia samuiensis]|uniref:DUF2987 domain-containing protein n=1 Tax=Swingsia samuiensis TaxID=1293412 RepID=A0A4Y6UJF7_9PROT|nr:DUF2987 domain-containing protein [Swingsia samuiensis]QDH17702.1 DUF2987 domain-containing protein [Swingsia samuiensis]